VEWYIKCDIATLTSKAFETGLPPNLSQQLFLYAPSRAYIFPHPNFFKFHVPTFAVCHAVACLLQTPGTHCLMAFVLVNF